MTLALIAALTAFAWLLPNHYLPWTAAWADALALMALCLLAIWSSTLTAGTFRMARPLFVAAALSLTMLLLQAASGKIVFLGDALMAAVYLTAWVVGVLTGHRVASSPDADSQLEPILAAWLFAAIASVGVALVQWTGIVGSNIYVVDLPPATNPWANVAQKTHFSTICFIGLCSLGWLHQRLRIGQWVFWISAVFLLIGMASSGARTAWLQMACLVVWLLFSRSSTRSQLPAAKVWALAAVFAILVIAWPTIAESLLLSSGRLRDDQLSSGFRLRHWAMMLDAIGREPWAGHGWQQIGKAQQLVALDHPTIGEHIESSHNLVLDLLLWNGIPIGLLIAGLLIFWFLSRARRCSEARTAWLLAAIGGLLAHAMVEFPLEYAYFLIPFGLLIGAVDGSSRQVAGRHISRGVALGSSVMLAVALTGIGRDYFRAEEDYRIMRLESARIGTDRMLTPPPQLNLLDQLQAYLVVARIEPRPGMELAQIELMRKVAGRYGDPAVLMNLALATGLNGQPVEAARTLALLCTIHAAYRCTPILERWRAIALRVYPQLSSIPLPQPAPR